jgi:hypothetical protein
MSAKVMRAVPSIFFLVTATLPGGVPATAFEQQPPPAGKCRATPFSAVSSAQAIVEKPWQYWQHAAYGCSAWPASHGSGWSEAASPAYGPCCASG